MDQMGSPFLLLITSMLGCWLQELKRSTASLLVRILWFSARLMIFMSIMTRLLLHLLVTSLTGRRRN